MERTGADIIDEILVLAAQGGNEEAVCELVRRWHPRLLRHAALMSRDQQRGADAAQEAWVTIIKKLHRLRDPSRFGAWAYRIVTNKCRDEMRRAVRDQKAMPLCAGIADEPGPLDDGDSDEIVHLRNAIRRLPPDQRALLSLRYADRLTVPVIAGVLGVPAGTIKSRLHSAHRALRDVLDPGSWAIAGNTKNQSVRGVEGASLD